jgi:probable HAF family extracellular repeat protein
MTTTITSVSVLIGQRKPWRPVVARLSFVSAGAVFLLSHVLMPSVGLASTDARVPPAPGYEVHELTLNGAGCRAAGIDAGVVVGWCNTPEGTSTRAFVWTEATGVVDIGTLGGSNAGASAVHGGRVVGSSSVTEDTESHAYKWSVATGMLDLGTLGGPWAGASSVSGDAVVGESATISGDVHAFLWTAATEMIDLPTLAGGTETSAAEIDDNLIAGWSTTVIPGRRAVAWRTNGEIIDLIGEPIESGGIFVRGDGAATGVRNGLVVGYRRIVPTEESRAFAWREEEVLVDLGVIPGSNESFAFDTDGQWVVGQLSGVGGPTGSTTRAFVWSEARGMAAITPASITAWATHVLDGRVLGIYHTRETNGGRTFVWTTKRGLVDVTPRGFPGWTVPAGIDAEGRILVVHEDEDPLHARSAVLIPNRLRE